MPDPPDDTAESMETRVPDTRPSDGLGAPVLNLPRGIFDPVAPAPVTLHRLIGRGGFGEVFEANQTSLGRTVAVKRIRQDIYNRLVANRSAMGMMETGFRKEAMITAKLEHPGIAPIHDMVLDGEGRPMLVMKMVRGAPWDQLIRIDFKQPVPEFLSRHLPILIAIGQAVAFAHSQGVIHRDLKPSQAMVGQFGEVQLMDWGVAVTLEEIRYAREAQASRSDRARSSGEVPIRPRARVLSGTTAFMAPEQTEEGVLNVGPWTDVYCLGGCLYFLLTGRVPHPATNQEELVDEARRGYVPPPAERAPHREIHPDLADMAMRAMAVRIEERYSSAEAFVAELQDFMGGVSRRRESIQLTKSVEQCLQDERGSYALLDDCHTRLDRAAMQWPENNRLRELRDEVASRYATMALDNGDLVLARFQVERVSAGDRRTTLANRVSAMEQARSEDEQRLHVALHNAQDLISFMLGDLYQGLQAIGRLDLLGKVSEKAMGHLESYREEDRSEDVQRSRMITLRQIADILRAQGRPRDALRVLGDSLAIAENFVAQNPRSTPWWDDLADGYESIANTTYDQGDLEATVQWHTQCLAIRQSLAQETDPHPRSGERTAQSHHNLSSAWWRRGNQNEAIRHQQAARTVIEELLAAAPLDAGLLAAMAQNHIVQGWILRALGRTDEAVAAHIEALEIRRALAARDPSSLRAIGEVAWSLRSVGLLTEDCWLLTESRDAYLEALDISRRLVDGDPANPRRLVELAFTHGGIGRTWQCMENWEAAEAAYKAGIALQATMVLRDTTNARLHREYVYNLIGLSSLMEETGRHREAYDQAAKGLEISRAINGRLQGGNPALEELEGRAHVHLGRAALGLGRGEEARRQFQEAVKLLTPLLREGEFPAVQEEPLALALLHLGRHKEAHPHVERLKRKNWRGRSFRKLLEH